jgi:hypothetical protein
MARVEAACQVPYADEHTRALALDRLCLELYDELFPDAARAIYTVHDAERRAQLVRQAETESAPAPEADASAPPSWELADRPALAPDVRVLAAVSAADGPSDALYLARGATLEAELAFDPTAPWAFEVLQCLGREHPSPTVGELAARCQVEPAALRGLLDQLYELGCVA